MGYNSTSKDLQAYRRHLASGMIGHLEGRYVAYQKGVLICSRETESELRDMLREVLSVREGEATITKVDLSDLTK